MIKIIKQTSMKTTRVLMSMLVLLAFSVGSYASSNFPKNPKAKCEMQVCAVPATQVASKTPDPIQFGMLVEPFLFYKESYFYVPVKIGKVINKPFVKYKYKGCQHYYHCNGSFDC